MRLRRVLGFGLPVVFLGQCAPQQCAPAPAPPPATATFGPGVRVVGRDIAAGTYYARSTAGCYWERASGLGGTFDEVIANDFSTGQHLVTIEPTDVAFKGEPGCGVWTMYAGSAEPVDRIAPGDWHVGHQVAPGRWVTEGETDGCYWERAAGFTHEFEELISNSFGDGQRVVDIAATDVRFSSSENCGAWVRIA